jgi:hypothetical protein
MSAPGFTEIEPATVLSYLHAARHVTSPRHPSGTPTTQGGQERRGILLPISAGAAAPLQAGDLPPRRRRRKT